MPVNLVKIEKDEISWGYTFTPGKAGGAVPKRRGQKRGKHEVFFKF